MHELSITQDILAIALDEAKAARANKITRIDITVGELSGISDECVKFYFDFLSKNTIAAEATLSFQRSPTTLRCRLCDRLFTPDSDEWSCPDCHEPKVDIVTGRESYVSSIEVD